MNVVLIALSGFILLACSGSKDPQAFVEWVDDPANGLSKKIELEGANLQLSYLPAEYFAVKELMAPGVIDSTLFKDKLSKKKEFVYFRLTYLRVLEQKYFETADEFGMAKWISEHLTYVSESCSKQKELFVYAEENNLKNQFSTFLIGYPKCTGPKKGFTITLKGIKPGTDLELTLSEQEIQEIPEINFTH